MSAAEIEEDVEAMMLHALAIPQDAAFVDLSSFIHVTELPEEGWSKLSSLKPTLNETHLPPSLHTIKERAFEHFRSLVKVHLPEKVKVIGAWDFHFCEAMTGELDLKSVELIGNGAFQYCSGLTGKLLLPPSLKRTGEWSFGTCYGLSDIDLQHIEIIDVGSFEFCNGLKELTFPPAVKTIGAGAFYHCKEMTNLTVSFSLEKIEEHAFSYCESLDLDNIFLPAGLIVHQLAFSEDDKTSSPAIKKFIEEHYERHCIWKIRMNVLMCLRIVDEDY